MRLRREEGGGGGEEKRRVKTRGGRGQEESLWLMRFLMCVSLLSGLDSTNAQITEYEEQLKKLQQTLDIEKVKKAEAINKLTQVRQFYF